MSSFMGGSFLWGESSIIANEVVTKCGILELLGKMEQGRKIAGFGAKAKWSIKVAKPEQSSGRSAKSQYCKEELC